MNDSSNSSPPPPVAAKAVPASVRRITTTLVALWGLLSAYALAYGAIVETDLRTILASIVPLAAVWAAMDRKRWGRMTLVFVSAIACIGYVITLMYVAATGRGWMDGEFTLANCASMALREMWNDYPEAGIVGLGLAAFSLFWMFRRTVLQEFSKGKQIKLSPGQRVIAIVLAFLWLYTMLFSQLAPVPRMPALAPPRHRAGTTPF